MSRSPRGRQPVTACKILGGTINEMQCTAELLSAIRAFSQRDLFRAFLFIRYEPTYPIDLLHSSECDSSKWSFLFFVLGVGLLLKVRQNVVTLMWS